MIAAPETSAAQSDRPRMAGFVRTPPGVDPYTAVYCAQGHPISQERIRSLGEWGVLPCRFREPPGRVPPCDQHVLVVKVLRLVTGEDGEPLRKLYVAQMDWREWAYLETAPEGRDVYEIIAWLGCRYDPPRVRRRTG